MEIELELLHRRFMRRRAERMLCATLRLLDSGAHILHSGMGWDLCSAALPHVVLVGIELLQCFGLLGRCLGESRLFFKCFDL